MAIGGMFLDPYMALFGSLLGAGGGLLSGLGGSGKARRNQIAPGLSKYTAQDESEWARDLGEEALGRYTEAMEGLTGEARAAGADLRGIFGESFRRLNRGQQALAGQAGRATAETAGVYRDYGRDAENVARENYSRLLAEIDAQQKIARARQGGLNSGQDMIAAGQRAEALHAYNTNLADIAQRRAELVGGAIERGRARELGIGQGGQDLYRGLLDTQLATRERAFTLPAQFRQAAINTRFNTEMTPTFLYPYRNLQLALGGGSYAPGASDPVAEIGRSLSGIGGYFLGSSINDPLERYYGLRR